MRQADGVVHAVVTLMIAPLLLVVLPGPDSLLVVRSIVLRGRAAAARTVAGVLTGLGVWVAAAALGLSALLRASPPVTRAAAGRRRSGGPRCAGP